MLPDTKSNLLIYVISNLTCNLLKCVQLLTSPSRSIFHPKNPFLIFQFLILNILQIT
jgi:hypothetical protein